MRQPSELEYDVYTERWCHIPSGGFVVIILTCAVEEISATESGEENWTTSVNNFDT